MSKAEICELLSMPKDVADEELLDNVLKTLLASQERICILESSLHLRNEPPLESDISAYYLNKELNHVFLQMNRRIQHLEVVSTNDESIRTQNSILREENDRLVRALLARTNNTTSLSDVENELLTSNVVGVNSPILQEFTEQIDTLKTENFRLKLKLKSLVPSNVE
ncbi:hypothetical protein PCE1_001363 [Barthelona sp. PCE]